MNTKMLDDLFADDNWAQVEVFRQAHGELPNKNNAHLSNDREDTAVALQKLAHEILSDDPPNAFNVASVMFYAGKLLRKPTTEKEK